MYLSLSYVTNVIEINDHFIQQLIFVVRPIETQDLCL